MKPGPKKTPAPKTIGEHIGCIARIHLDTEARMKRMEDALLWIAENTNAASEVYRRAHAALSPKDGQDQDKTS